MLQVLGAIGRRMATGKQSITHPHTAGILLLLLHLQLCKQRLLLACIWQGSSKVSNHIYAVEGSARCSSWWERRNVECQCM